MGGASQIYAELILLKAAVENGPYDFYHLITGVDFPLMSQDEILDFYDKHKECLFISGRILTDSDARFLRRVKYYYPFQERFKRGSKMSDFLKKGALALQQLIGVNRLSSSIKYGIGSAYFDIPDGFANYVLSQEDWIRATFHDSFCADELFIQTVYFNSPYYSDGTCRYHAEAQNNEYIQQSYFDVKRAIDWRRGEPYVFQYSDRDMLINSNCFFARKFDERVDKDIIDFLSSYVMENNKSQLES